MNRPAVIVLTPVFNGEAYLSECIESVLGQDYSDFEYVIVDNCSTDRTRTVAQSYADRDPRVRVITNGAFVSAIENHNIAFGLVPGHSRYCKVVSADDWILPGCISKMVRFADEHPSVGVVGCYQRSADRIRWRGLPPDVEFLSGRDAARVGLLDGIHVLGTPTSVLYRADLVRERRPFFPHLHSHADASACYECFEKADFGFLHEVLAVERVHSEQWTTAMEALDVGSLVYLDVLLKYGPRFLTPEEFERRRDAVFDRYYRDLGGSVWKLKSKDFWRFHRSRLAEMGFELDRARVVRAAIKEAASEARHPASAIQKVLTTIKGDW